MTAARDDAKLELVLAAVRAGKPQRLRARGGSMYPSIRDAETVELRALDGAVREGAVVAVRAAGGRFLVHRACGVRADGAVLTKGDNCPRPDGWFRRDEIAAVVERVDRGRGWEELARAPARKPSLPRRALARVLRRYGRDG